MQSATQNPCRNEESPDLSNQYETKGPKNVLPNNIFNRNNERREHQESHTGSTISPPMECSGRNTDIHYASVALFVQSGRLIHHTHNGHHYGSLLFSVPVDQLWTSSRFWSSKLLFHDSWQKSRIRYHQGKAQYHKILKSLKNIDGNTTAAAKNQIFTIGENSKSHKNLEIFMFLANISQKFPINSSWIHQYQSKTRKKIIRNPPKDLDCNSTVAVKNFMHANIVKNPRFLHS